MCVCVRVCVKCISSQWRAIESLSFNTSLASGIICTRIGTPSTLPNMDKKEKKKGGRV